MNDHVQLTCSSCGKALKVKRPLMGKKVRCSCGQVSAVTGPAAEAPVKLGGPTKTASQRESVGNHPGEQSARADQVAAGLNVEGYDRTRTPRSANVAASV